MSQQLKEKIEANSKRIKDAIEKYEIFTPELIQFLGEDFFHAPASTRKDLHNAFPGGLVDHLLKVAKYAVSINRLVPEKLRVDEKSVMKVSFLSEIGKTFLYKLTNEDWKKKNGTLYDFNEDLIAMSVGERSLYYAVNSGVKLTEEEAQAILNYGKSSEDKQAKWYSCILAQILRQAIELAILEEAHG